MRTHALQAIAWYVDEEGLRGALADVERDLRRPPGELTPASVTELQRVHPLLVRALELAPAALAAAIGGDAGPLLELAAIKLEVVAGGAEVTEAERERLTKQGAERLEATFRFGRWVAGAGR